MREVARLLGDMLSAGVIIDYALFGAVAQMRYTEAVATMDADVLVALPPGSALDLLRPKGYKPEGEAILVGDWPVQFIPAFSSLTEEAMREAQTTEVEGVRIRVVSAVHLAVIALSAGRPKDFARILSLLESGAVTREQVRRLADQHGLSSAWRRFQAKFLE
jgi:hypothetical protein